MFREHIDQVLAQRICPFESPRYCIPLFIVPYASADARLKTVYRNDGQVVADCIRDGLSQPRIKDGTGSAPAFFCSDKQR